MDVDEGVREWTNGLSVPADHPSDQCVHASEVPGGVPGPVSGSKNFVVVVFKDFSWNVQRSSDIVVFGNVIRFEGVLLLLCAAPFLLYIPCLLVTL